MAENTKTHAMILQENRTQLEKRLTSHRIRKNVESELL